MNEQEAVDAPTSARTEDGGARLWRYIGYYGLGEVAQRASRIVTTVLVARTLAPDEMGVAATAIAVFEVLRVVANAGVGQAVIRAEQSQLAATCAAAHRMMWRICLALALVQSLVGLALGALLGRPAVAAMIAALAGVYLMMPAGLIQAYLLQRSARHAVVAVVATGQAVVDNVLTLVLTLSGLGPWAIVLPKLLTVPIWLVGMRRAETWRRDRSVVALPATPLLAYAAPVFGAELLNAVRLQFDKAIVGAMLGIETLGVYTFVFNAGIGLSLSLATALATALYPHLATASGDLRQLAARLDAAFVRYTLPVAALVIVQALAAPIYVPLLFGAKWSSTATMVAMLCASAAAKIIADTTAQAMRAAGATAFDAVSVFMVTVASLSGLVAGARYGLFEAVASLSAASAISNLSAAIAARVYLGSLYKVDTPRSLRVTHLIDDAALGGVTRFLDALGAELGSGVEQRRVVAHPTRPWTAKADGDVVVIHFTSSWAKLPYLALLRLRAWRRPMIIVEHSYSGGFETQFVRARWRFRALLRVAYALADDVVAVSYGQAAWLRGARLLPARKLWVIPPFTATSALADVPSPSPCTGALRLGAYGRFTKQKGFDILLAAFAAVPRGTAQLTLRGFGPDEVALQNQARNLTNATVGGAVDDLTTFLATVDAVVVPSRFEPYGQVALEARQAGRPLIVADVDGLSEQVGDGGGLLFARDDAGALAAAIVELAAARADGRFAAMSAAARASASGHARRSGARWRSLLTAGSRRACLADGAAEQSA